MSSHDQAEADERRFRGTDDDDIEETFVEDFFEAQVDAAPSPHGQDVEGLTKALNDECACVLTTPQRAAIMPHVRDLCNALRSRQEPENGVVSRTNGVPNEVLDRLEEYAATVADGELIAFDIREVCRVLRQEPEPEPDATIADRYRKEFPGIVEAWDRLWAYVSHRAYGEGRDKQEETRAQEWVTTALRLNKVRQKLEYLMDCEIAGGARNLLSPLGPVEPAWQPIESAPKDGTPVLVGFFDLLGEFYSYVPDVLMYDGIHWCDPYGERSTMPSHWMPLPAPPARSEEGKS